jgi:hypothetical protein
MPQTKEVHRKYMRDRRKGSQHGSQIVLPGGGEVTPSLLAVLINKDRRSGLESIYKSLKVHNQTDNVRYGVNGAMFTDIGEMLAATG